MNLSSGNIKVEKTINNVLSQLHYDFGYQYLKEGKKLKARQMFDISLIRQFNLKTYIMKILSHVPSKLLVISDKLFKLIFKPSEIEKSKEYFEELLAGRKG